MPYAGGGEAYEGEYPLCSWPTCAPVLAPEKDGGPPCPGLGAYEWLWGAALGKSGCCMDWGAYAGDWPGKYVVGAVVGVDDGKALCGGVGVCAGALCMAYPGALEDGLPDISLLGGPLLNETPGICGM
jgi:hypothetical protein